MPPPDPLATAPPRDGLAVVIDFDNTVTTVDVGDELADRFGDPRWRELDRAHRRGEVPLETLLRFMFESMRATEAEIVEHARRVGRLRAGFREFRRAALGRGTRLVLASGGLDLYIRPILGEEIAGLELETNRGRFEAGRLVVEFPRAGRGCGRCGNCKGAIVDELRASGCRRVVAVGDGTSDTCMATAADEVLARGALLDWCAAHGVRATPFADFYDVMRAVR